MTPAPPAELKPCPTLVELSHLARKLTGRKDALVWTDDRAIWVTLKKDGNIQGMYLGTNPKTAERTLRKEFKQPIPLTIREHLRILANLLDEAHDTHIWDPNEKNHPKKGCITCLAVKAAREALDTQ